MYYFLLNAKEASEGTMTYFISRTKDPEMNYGLSVTLTTRAKIFIAIMFLHVFFLTLNLYVFTKLADDIDVSLFGRKRRYWTFQYRPNQSSSSDVCFRIKMFYFFKANPLPEQKVQERPLPKTGKLFLILFTVFHVLFLFFNMYYFMPQASESVESSSVDIENSIDVEN